MLLLKTDSRYLRSFNFKSETFLERTYKIIYFIMEANIVEDKRRLLHIFWKIRHGNEDNNPVYRPFPPQTGKTKLKSGNFQTCFFLSNGEVRLS